jgi:Na+-translocating ferredoxin:NAD+ oxidoreductase RnfE subunit
LVLILPVLLLLPEAILDIAANQLGGDRGGLLWWAYAVQLFSFIAFFASVIVNNGMRIGWALVTAALKSVFFTILVGVPFCFEMDFLTALFLPGDLVWLQVVACVGPTTALVLGISFWFAPDLPHAVSKAA